MASLPALGPMLAARQVPINPARLERRLGLLEPHDRATVEEVANLLSWSRFPLISDDAVFVRKAIQVVPTLSGPTLAELVRDRLELRTVVAALRRRSAREEPPSSDLVWGFGRFTSRIRDNWREPALGVQSAFPWVTAARDALEKQDAVALERIVLEAAWNKASRLAVRHDFDVEAVALYLVRWHLLERWTRYDAEAAAARFTVLVESALAAAPENLTEALS